jgi:hypothetical protein
VTVSSTSNLETSRTPLGNTPIVSTLENCSTVQRASF